MNKGITVFILVVLACAMGLILYSYVGDNDPPVKRATLATDARDVPALDDSTVNLRDSVLAGPGSSQNNAGAASGAMSADSGQAKTAPIVVTPAYPGEKPRILPPVNNGAQAQAKTQEQGDSAANLARDAGKGQTAPETSEQAATPSASTGTKTEKPAQRPAAPADTQKPSAGSSGIPQKKEPQKAEPSKNPDKPQADAPKNTEQAAQTKTAKDSHILRNISLHFAGQGMRLRIEADSPFQIKTFALNDPERLVVDLAGKWEEVRAPNVPSNNMISGVRVGKQDAGPRIVLDLKKKASKHDVNKISDQVIEIVIH